MDIAGDILLQILSTNKQLKMVKDKRNTAKDITDPDNVCFHQIKNLYVRHYAMYAWAADVELVIETCPKC